MLGIMRISAIGAMVLLGTAPSDAAQAARACMTPTWQIVVDPEQSRPMAPQVLIRSQDLATPADGTFHWGNGRFGIAVIDTPDGRGNLATMQPTYDYPGTYSIRLDIVDACGARWQVGLEVGVPLVLPPSTWIACPGQLDQDGLCVVTPGMTHSFGIEGATDGRDAWHWTSGGVGGDGSGTAGATFELTLAANHRTYLQATRPRAGGWAVTPALLVVAQAPRHDAISTYLDPRRVTADEDATLGFTSPADAAAAQPAILVDGREVAAAASANLRLVVGDHEVAYELRYPDGQVVRRQIFVTVRPAGVPLTLIALGAFAALAAALVAPAAVRRRRRVLLTARRGRCPDE